MGIVNRDLDPSQQQAIFQSQVRPTATASTYILMVVPYQAQVMSAMQTVKGLSGAPNHSLWIQRFIAGSGVTSINIGASIVASAFATSAAQTFTLTSASTNLLQAGDLILLSTDAANTNAAEVAVALSLKALQDIKTNFGA